MFNFRPISKLDFRFKSFPVDQNSITEVVGEIKHLPVLFGPFHALAFVKMVKETKTCRLPSFK